MRVQKHTVPVGFVLVSEAAKRLNLHPTTVVRKISRGELPAKRLLGPFVIPERSIAEMEASRPSTSPSPVVVA